MYNKIQLDIENILIQFVKSSSDLKRKLFKQLAF